MPAYSFVLDFHFGPPGRHRYTPHQATLRVGRPDASRHGAAVSTSSTGWRAMCVHRSLARGGCGPLRTPAARAEIGRPVVYQAAPALEEVTVEYLRSFGLFGLWQLWQSSGPGGRVHFMIAEKSSDVKVKRVSRLTESKARCCISHDFGGFYQIIP